jgi:hypothetical protein
MVETKRRSADVAVLAGVLAGLLAAWVAIGPREHAPVTVARQADGLTFAPGVAPGDRRWILAAIGQVRPEAQRLIDAVAGRTDVTVFDAPGAWLLGQAHRGQERYTIRFNVARLDGWRVADRTAVVVHELGHVIDFALVPDDLRDRLAAQVPRTGTCLQGFRGDCASAQERFADTFAKWALRGAMSATGAGYGIPAPPSLEDWGAPLGALAAELEAKR